MPAQPLTPEQKADAERLHARFKAWQQDQKDRKLPSSQAEAASRLEFGQSALSQYLQGRIPLNVKTLAKFCTLLGCEPEDISPSLAAEMKAISKPLQLKRLNTPEAAEEWVQEQIQEANLFAQLDESELRAIAESKGFPARPISVYNSLEELPPETTVLITHVDVALSAGNGRETWHVEKKEPLPFQADYIRRLKASPKDLVAVKVRGDSMERGLFDDDTVVVDTADRRIPASGGVFALVYAGEMLVKRLFKMPDGSIDIVSDNPKYKSLVVPPDQLEHIDIVGRVKYRSGMGDF
ncbi:LexA repressor [Ralstonia mannitolilytica]|uniref:LexA repressor n=1 Tax=Ralstonia mannitolilytica TaxID=105219 RepID=A0ABN9KI28_9RALS|nr:LexA family transcriptional regulator [Ralstonia mannitolilytica]CAJ0895754.1 LexA repressor [Ralstonia mannitolilytica]